MSSENASENVQMKPTFYYECTRMRNVLDELQFIVFFLLLSHLINYKGIIAVQKASPCSYKKVSLAATERVYTMV